MKKAMALLFLLILSAAFLFAEIKFQNPESGYEKNMAEVFAMPAVGSSWGIGYDNANFLGLIGVADQSHPMRFSVSSNCRFVSASDPTKYREVSIYFLSRFSPNTSMVGGHAAFEREVVYDGTTTVSGELYVNMTNDYQSITGKTKNGVNQTLELYSPVCDAGTYYDYGAGSSVIGGFWYDMVLVQDALSTEEQKHMSAADDYVLEIQISYDCVSNCSSHNGSLLLSYRGYYQVANPESSYASFIVIPNSNSGSLNIGTVATRGTAVQPIEIGTFSFTSYFVYSTPPDPSTLFTKYKIFASSSSIYNDSSADGFRMKKIGVVSADTRYNSVPLVVITRDSQSGRTVSYDGIDYYTVNGDRRTSFDSSGTYETLAFPTPTAGNNGYLVRQDATISVYVPSVDPLFNTATLEAGDVLTGSGLLAGAYQETIYFHLVVE